MWAAHTCVAQPAPSCILRPSHAGAYLTGAGNEHGQRLEALTFQATTKLPAERVLVYSRTMTGCPNPGTTSPMVHLAGCLAKCAQNAITGSPPPTTGAAVPIMRTPAAGWLPLGPATTAHGCCMPSPTNAGPALVHVVIHVVAWGRKATRLLRDIKWGLPGLQVPQRSCQKGTGPLPYRTRAQP